MTDETHVEPSEEQETSDAPENDSPVESPDSGADDAIEIDGQKYTMAELRRFKDTRPNLEKHYQKKFQSLSQKEKELEALRAELEERRNAPAATSPQAEDPLDEVIPGLGSRLSKFESEFGSIKQTLESVKSEADRMSQESAREAAWQEAVDVYDRQLNAKSGRPFAKAEEMRNFMQVRNLEPTPENAELAYAALYGYKLGEQTGAQRAAKRTNVQAPMGASEVGAIAGSTPGEVPGVRKSLRDTSWEELAARAAKDPRRPKITP